MRKKPEWQVPADLDPECRALCVALNKLPGFFTTNSCCGHGDQPGYEEKHRARLTPEQAALVPPFTPHPYWMFFHVDKPEAALPLLYWMQSCHTGVKGKWRVNMYTDCVGDTVFYMLEGPTGTVAYEDSLLIAKAIEEYEVPKPVKSSPDFAEVYHKIHLRKQSKKKVGKKVQ